MATTATVGFDGELVLPPEIQRTLGIAPGSRVEIVVQGRHVEITPRERPIIDRERAQKALENLHGIFAGEPSLEDEYFLTRDKDRW